MTPAIIRAEVISPAVTKGSSPGCDRLPSVRNCRSAMLRLTAIKRMDKEMRPQEIRLPVTFMSFIAIKAVANCIKTDIVKIIPISIFSTNSPGWSVIIRENDAKSTVIY